MVNKTSQTLVGGRQFHRRIANRNLSPTAAQWPQYLLCLPQSIQCDKLITTAGTAAGKVSSYREQMTDRNGQDGFCITYQQSPGKSSKGMWQMSHPSGTGVASLALQDSPPFQPFLRPSPSSSRTSPVLQPWDCKIQSC